jgi:hypothetical protein
MRKAAGTGSAICFVIAAVAIWWQTAPATNAAGLNAAHNAIGWRAEPTAAAKVADRFPTASEMFVTRDFIRAPDGRERTTTTIASSKTDRQPRKGPDCGGADRAGCQVAVLDAAVRQAPQPATIERRVDANTSELVRTQSRAPSPSCRQDLPAATARMERALAQVRHGRGTDSAEACAAYRRGFFEIVKAREVTALCKTGPERVQDLGRIDAAVEDINGAIATSCGT